MPHHPINRMLNKMCALLRFNFPVNRPDLSGWIPGSLSRLGFLLSILISTCDLCLASDLAQDEEERRLRLRTISILSRTVGIPIDINESVGQVRRRVERIRTVAESV